MLALLPHAARASTGHITAGNSQANCFALAGGADGEISTFNNPAATWDAWDAPWQFTNGQPSGTESWNNWVAAGNSMILGEDLIPQAVDSGNWEASCAAGDYDSYATTLAQNLVSDGAGNITIRLGIEANGNWETDYVGTDPSGWATCYDNEVSAMRAVSGAHFLFVWNPNACYSDAASGGDLSSWHPVGCQKSACPVTCDDGQRQQYGIMVIRVPAPTLRAALNGAVRAGLIAVNDAGAGRRGGPEGGRGPVGSSS
jgi:hypothetical protein